MPFYNPGPGAVQTAYVSYRAVDLTDDLTLFWPNAFQATPNVMAAFMNFKTVSAPGLTVTLPDARQVSVGQNFIITNTSAVQSFQLLTNDGVFLANIYNGTQPGTNPTNVFYFVLENNTDDPANAGIWREVGFGSTTAAPSPTALAGPGLIADDGQLWTNAITQNIDATPFVVNDGRFNGTTFLWIIGTGGITLDPAADATIQPGFYFYLNTYQATGQITITPPAGKKIDNADEKVINPKQSLMLVLDAAGNWWSIGYTAITSSNFSILNFPVTGGTVSLSASDAASSLIYITGTLTSDCTIIFPNINSEWQVVNATTGGHTVTLQLLGGGSIGIAQNTANIFYSFGSEFHLIPNVPTITSVGITSTDGLITVGASPITPTSPGPITLTVDTIPISKGGTGQVLRSPALNALMPPTPSLGDIIYWDGAVWTTLPIGTAGQQLTVGGGGTPVWAPA